MTITWRVRLAASLVVGASCLSAQADPPKVAQLRTQKVDGDTYFHVRFDWPIWMKLPDLRYIAWFRDSQPPLTRLPRLVPQDDAARDVSVCWDFSEIQERFPRAKAGRPDQWPEMPKLHGLHFIGKAKKDKASFLLIYPTVPDAKKKTSDLEEVLRVRNAWVEVPVTLDFSEAEPIKGRVARASHAFPKADDLQGRWALDQAVAFSILEAQAPEFGFYGLAREAMARRYLVPALPVVRPWWGGGDRTHLRLYEITTGAAAIAETLALDRLRNPIKTGKPEARIHDVAKLRGIDIAEHDWVKMMAGKKPAAEPLADMVPHDNYYIHFKHYGKFLELMDLVSEVGMTVGRAMSVQSREDHLKARIEEQLCLKNTGLAKLFGPTIIKGLAITGSDPYLREGSDLTLLFQVNNKKLFLSGVNAHIEEARKKWGKDLKEEEIKHGGVVIESFRSPLREVSLFRTVIDDVVIYSNSPAGIQRVIDAQQGKRKRLSESLDFQYMRTVFRLDDPEEDGFLFLSDPFIRNLVGPALRIKERRRLEALTSLYMLSNGALFTAWETGKLPAHHNEILLRTGLQQHELVTPEGRGTFWDAEKGVAISDVYNTIRFATPLIELPIDRVTATEAGEYEEFRLQYLGLWTRTFDPIGMRFSLRGKEIKWDTFILPLVQISQYNELRRWAGGGTLKLDPGVFSDKTVVHFLAHFSPAARADLRRLFVDFVKPKLPDGPIVGNWISLHLDDTPAFKSVVAKGIADAMEHGYTNWTGQEILQLPITFGWEVLKPKAFTEALDAVEKRSREDRFLGHMDWETLKKPYKGVSFGKITVNAEGVALYHAQIDDAWYLSLSQKSLEELVDRSILKKEGKLKSKDKDAPDINTVLYIAPSAMKELGPGVRLYLEYEAHRTALGNSFLWHPFYRGGLVDARTSAAEKKDLALRLLGYEPMSPDLAADFYDPKTDEVISKRHGSPRRPILHDGVDADSPLGKLVEAFDTIRADMRFREDGLHATVTIRRK